MRVLAGSRVRPGAGVRLSAAKARGIVAPSSLPSWLNGVAVGQWVEIAGSSFSVLGVSMTGSNGSGADSQIVNSWNGFALKPSTSTIYSVANGGHDDYWGNEVAAIDLRQNAPAWTRLLESSPSSAVTGPTSPYYDDGKPCSCHSYGTLWYVPQDDRIVRVSSMAMTPGGQNETACAVYDLASNAYLAAGTVADTNTNIVETPICAWCDPATGNLFAFSAYQVNKWTRTTNTWSSPPGAEGLSAKGIDYSAAVDTTRNRALAIRGLDPGNVVYDHSNDTASQPSLTGSQAAWVNAGGIGIVYVPEIDRFLLRKNEAGGAVMQVHPTTWAVETYSTTGGSGITSGGSGNVFTRWKYLPELGCVAFYPHYTANWWALRVV